MHSSANPRSKFPMRICSNSARRREANPHGSSTARMTLGPPCCWTCLARLQVLHGGPPRKPKTHRSLIAWSHVERVYICIHWARRRRVIWFWKWQPLAATCSHSSGRKWPQVAASGRQHSLVTGSHLQPLAAIYMYTYIIHYSQAGWP